VGHGTLYYCLAYAGGILITGHDEDAEPTVNIILIANDTIDE